MAADQEHGSIPVGADAPSQPDSRAPLSAGEHMPADAVREYVDDYEWRGDEGDYIPTDKERLLIEDAIHGYLSLLSEPRQIRQAQAGKHTPGPWLVEHERGSDDYVVWTRQPHTGDLATVHGEDINGKFPAKANAHLIAAGPELLSELSGLVEWLHDNRMTIDGMFSMDELLAGPRAAIAKAEGRS